MSLVDRIAREEAERKSVADRRLTVIALVAGNAIAVCSLIVSIVALIIAQK